MSHRTARAAARVHESLVVGAHRIAAGHSALVDSVAARPVWWPARPRPAAANESAPEEQPASDEPAAEEPAADEPETTTKTKKTTKKAAGKKGAAKEKEGEKEKSKKKKPPAHTSYRPGPRRAIAAALHWTGTGAGFTDFLVRAGLLALGAGIAAYFSHPLLAALHPAVLCTIAITLVVYEVSPRLALFLAAGLTAALVSWVWLCVGAVLLLAVELAPTLAALLTLGLGAAAVHPAIMWPAALIWTIAAWRAGAPAEAEAEEAVEAADEVEGQVPGEEWGRALLWHVIESVATAQTAGRAGIHLDTILDSATEVGLLPEGTDQPTLRQWISACGLPTEDKIGMRIGGKPVTRVGLKIAAVTEALGTSPADLIRARAQAALAPASATPARPADEEAPETPAQPPAEAPSPTPLRLIPGGRQAPVSHPSPAPAQEVAQGAR